MCKTLDGANLLTLEPTRLDSNNTTQKKEVQGKGSILSSETEGTAGGSVGSCEATTGKQQMTSTQPGPFEKMQGIKGVQHLPDSQKINGNAGEGRESLAGSSQTPNPQGNTQNATEEKGSSTNGDITRTVDEETKLNKIDSNYQKSLETVLELNKELGGVLDEDTIKEVFGRSIGPTENFHEIQRRFEKILRQLAEKDGRLPSQRNKGQATSQYRGRKFLSPKQSKRTTVSTDSSELSSQERAPLQQRADFVPSHDYNETAIPGRNYRKRAGPVHMQSGRMRFVDTSPRMVFHGEDTKDTRYLAELYV